MPFNTKHTTRARWATLGLGLAYYDGRCEAERTSRGKVTTKRVDLRCRNNAVAENQGMAVCWRHQHQRDFFRDPDAEAFRER